MLLAIRIPCLIFNSISAYFALSFIYKNYHLSEYSPRLVMISVLIIAAFPSSLLSTLPFILNYDMFSSSVLCYMYTSLKWLHFFSRYNLLALTFYVLLILFTNLKRLTINKIGRALVLTTFAIVGVIELVILPYFGARAVDPITISGKKYKRACTLNSRLVTKILGNSILFVSTFVFFVSIILFFYYYVINKISPKDKKHNLFLTLALFGLVGCVNPLIFFFEKILNINLNKTVRNIVYDFMTAIPGLYSLIYYLVDVYSRKRSENIDVSTVLRVYKTRSLYKEYLSELGDRALWNMLLQWEEIFFNKNNQKEFDVLEQRNLTRKNALALLEKYLELQVMEVMQTDKFYYYYLKLKDLGAGDIDLMIEGSDSVPEI